MAGACTLCIAAASGTVAEPQVALAAQQESTVRVVQRDYTLTATGNPLLDIASLPFQNYFTIASTLGNLAAFIPPVNQATGAFFQGQWDTIPPLLQKAINDEIAAIAAVIQLPATIVAYDLNVIAGAFGGASVGNNVALSAVNSPAAAATPADLANGLVAVLSLPFQNYFTIASTLGNLAAFIPPVNQATGAFFTGQWDKIGPLLQKAFTDELAAINNVLQLPATLIKYNLDVIANAFGLGATSMNANMSSIEAQALTAALSTETATDTTGSIIDAETIDIETETDDAGTDSADTVTDGTEADTDVTEADTDRTDTVTDGTDTVTDGTDTDTDATETGTDATDTDTDATETGTDATDTDTDAKDADAKDADAKDADAKDADTKDADAKDADTNDTDKKDTDTNDKSDAGAE
jgi:hypothetical protein